MANETEQAGWAAAAILAVTTIVKSAFARSGKRDDTIERLLTECERRHDERDAKFAQLEHEVRAIAVEHATIKNEHARCPGEIDFLRRRIHRLEKGITPVHGTPMVTEEDTTRECALRQTTDGTILPPPIMSESVGGHER